MISTNLWPGDISDRSFTPLTHCEFRAQSLITTATGPDFQHVQLYLCCLEVVVLIMEFRLFKVGIDFSNFKSY